MSNYTSTANIILQVNGRQAQRMLAQLEKDARRLEQGIIKAATAGDKATMRKLQRELNSTKRIIDQLKGSSTAVETTLRRLDKASPKELNAALKQLQAQLNSIQRGTPAWDAHVAKIRAVKAELQKVNATLVTQKSLWERMNIALNNMQTFLFGALAAVSGLVMAGRRAVNSYAEMEEEMANTRKYTRMTKEDVLSLNDAFKEMDTRLARQELNALAQEGGRLGYNTLDTVKQYVNAAKVIKVALVDLGEGATQTIAKISNIFGIEEMYGVEKAMLKVGSTVNHLSQNCTASKPYLVEFAQRMAGIGSTAKMTVPEILAFGATLDAHGQKVEMSASALSRLVMKLYQSPRDIAQQVGLNVNYFTKVLDNDVTKGVVMFLEQLNKIGDEKSLAALAPLFKDMGMDGVRLAQVLANLSTHLDFLKWQLGEAKEAFREGTSATNEYTIFNNTVQAQIDKAKKSVSEMAVELGERLYPVMRHIYTSSSLFLRVLNVLVEFVASNARVIGTLASAIAAYYLWVGLAKTAQFLWNAQLAAGKLIASSFTYVVGLLKVAVIAMTQGLGAARTAMTALNATFKANPFGAIAAVVATLVVGIYNLSKATETASDRMVEARKKAGEYSEELIKEQQELDILFGKLKGATKGSELYEKAKQELIDQYGNYLHGLIDEKGEIIDLQQAYDRLTKSVERSVQVRGINNAKQTIVDEYSKNLAEALEGLRKNLEEYGHDAQKASNVVTQVAEAISSGKSIPKEAVDYIKSVSNINGGDKTTGEQVTAGFKSSVLGKLLHNYFNDLPFRGDEILENIITIDKTKTNELKTLEDMHNGVDPMRNVSRELLEKSIASLEKVVEGNKTAEAMTVQPGKFFLNMREVTVAEANKLIKQYKEELELKGGPINKNKDDDTKSNSGSTYTHGDGGSGSDKDRFKAEDFYRAMRQAYALINKAQGQKQDKEGNWKPYTAYDYDKEMANIDKSYYEKLLKRKDLSWLERLEMEAKYREAEAKVNEVYNEYSIEREDRFHTKKLINIRQQFVNGLLDQEKYNQLLEDEDVRHLGKVRDIYRKLAFAKINKWEEDGRQGAKPAVDMFYYNKYSAANESYLNRSAAIQTAKQNKLVKEEEAKQKERDRVKDTYFLPDEKKKRDYDSEIAILDDVYKRELELAKDNIERKLMLEKAYQAARLAIAKKYDQDVHTGFAGAIQKSVDWLNSDGGKALTQSVSTIASGMSNIFSQVTSIMQADLEIQTAAIEKRYEAEINAAQGNAYKVKKIEKQKEKDIAKAKNEANRKMFAMQVIQALAQTASNAIAAYGSAAAIPVVGHIMAPIAASMAVAAGMLQVVAIKKQQQASESQGYSEGGFTRPGRRDEVAGVVHAGEWVASQKLVNDTRVRPLLQALDYAQRTNTIGSLTAADVSRSITAPMVLAAQPVAMPAVNVVAPPASVVVQDNPELTSTIRQLHARLNEPFYTVNTVTGDHGILRAEDEYNKLIRNKSPKSRK